MKIHDECVYSIYKLTDTNDELYIGYTSKVENRLRSHKSKRDVKSFDIIYQSKDKEHILDMEETFISEYDSYNNGLNKTKNGKGIFGVRYDTSGFKFSKESKQLMSRKAKERIKRLGSPTQGIGHSKKTKKLFSKQRNGIVLFNKLQPIDIVYIKKLYKLKPELNLDSKESLYKKRSGAFCKLFSKQYNVSTTIIHSIINHKSYNFPNIRSTAKLTYGDAEDIREEYRTIDLSELLDIKKQRPYNKVFAEVYSKKYNVVPLTILNIITEKTFGNIKAVIDGRIKTPNGYESYDGIMKTKHSKYYDVTFNNTTTIKCSINHKFLSECGLFKTLSELSDNENLITHDGVCCVSNITLVNKSIWLYDIINAGKDKQYYTNGIVSHNCAFLSNKGTLINSQHLESIKGLDPEYKIMGIKFFKENNIIGRRLGLTVDVAEGIGGTGDYTVIQIFDIDNLEQIGEWRDNETTISEFTKFFIGVLQMLMDKGAREVFYTVESNPIGLSVLNLIDNSTSSILERVDCISDSYKRKGMLTTNKSKLAGCSMLKDFMESERLTVYSKQLISELKFFVKKGASFSAEIGMHDDLVMGLVIFMNMLKEIAKMDDDINDTVNKINVIDCYDEYEGEPMPFIF